MPDKLNVKLDISYGLYIYHMTVINVMIELGFTGSVYNLIIAIAISVLLAILSTVLANFIATKIKKAEDKKYDLKSDIGAA